MKPVTPIVQADANLIVSMSLLPKMMHVDYGSAAEKPACDLGPLQAGPSGYELFGDDAAGRHRTALPAHEGDPIAYVMPVVSIAKAIEASREGKAAPVEGYLLAIVTKADFTGWRFYTGMPDQDVLNHDMSDVLRNVGVPIFKRTTDNRVFIYVGKS